MKIKSKLLRAAQMCHAKNDIRYYLCGIHIKGNIIEATNGHYAVRMAMDEEVDGEHILNVKGIIPKKADESEFIFGDETIIKHRDSAGMLLSVHVVEVINKGRYPPIENFIPDSNKKVATEEIGFNTKYLALFDKMFGSPAKFELFGSKNSVKLTALNTIANAEYGNPVFVVMPCRLD
jgi:DNA polymerase-3 subunit beta